MERALYGRSTLQESRLYMAFVMNRIKEFRLHRGWTQEGLANKVGVSRQSINSIERGRYVPSLMLALTFARVFDCPVDQLFSLEVGNESARRTRR